MTFNAKSFQIKIFVTLATIATAIGDVTATQADITLRASRGLADETGITEHVIHYDKRDEITIKSKSASGFPVFEVRIAEASIKFEKFILTPLGVIKSESLECDDKGNLTRFSSSNISVFKVNLVNYLKDLTNQSDIKTAFFLTKECLRSETVIAN